jgi:tetratricopeptide (TPR) repeat protein
VLSFACFVDLSSQAAIAQDTTGFLTFQNDSLGINIQYPSDWRYFSSEQNDGTLISFTPKVNQTGILIVGVQPLDLIGRYSLEEYTDYVVGQSKSLFPALFGPDRVNMTGPERMLFSGIPALRTQFSYLTDDKQNSEAFVTEFITTIRNSHGYFVQFSPESEYQQKIVNSITFTTNSTISQKENNCTTLTSDGKLFRSDTENDASCLNAQGIFSELDGRYLEALEYFDRVLAIDPSHIDALFHKGKILTNLGRYEDAMVYFDKGITIAPDDTFLLGGKGLALAGLGKFEDALIWYDKGLAIYPNDTFIMENKAEALRNLGKYNEAITYYDKVLVLEPNATDALYNKGLALGSLGKYDEAIKYYDKVLALEPNATDALTSKGVALGSLGKYDEAITFFDKVLALEPNNINALYNKGVSLGGLGKPNDAISYFDRALAIDANFTIAQKGKELLLANLGK